MNNKKNKYIRFELPYTEDDKTTIQLYNKFIKEMINNLNQYKCFISSDCKPIEFANMQLINQENLDKYNYIAEIKNFKTITSKMFEGRHTIIYFTNDTINWDIFKDIMRAKGFFKRLQKEKTLNNNILFKLYLDNLGFIIVTIESNLHELSKRILNEMI